MVLALLEAFGKADIKYMLLQHKTSGAVEAAGFPAPAGTRVAHYALWAETLTDLTGVANKN